MTTLEILQGAKNATRALSLLSTEEKNQALLAMADALISDTDAILAANAADIEGVKGLMNEVMIDRLRLTRERIASMAEGIRDVVKLPDPVGKIIERFTRPNGIQVSKVRVPMGVVAIIYESRPNVTSDAAALALKSGNVCVLRGGKEAYRSSTAIVKALKKGLSTLNLPTNFVNILEDTTRAGANELMTATEYVDLLIPRGGAGLIRACVDMTFLCRTFRINAKTYTLAVKFSFYTKLSKLVNGVENDVVSIV